MKARITVIRKAFYKDLIDQYFPDLADRASICTVFEEGQTFDVDGPFPSKPDGFCDWAWSDIRKVVALTMMGADPTPGTEFSCCSDGLRPVTFRIQRLET